MQVFKIPERNWDYLQERFDKMVRRSKKCEVEPPKFVVIHEQDEVIKDEIIRYLFVTIEGVKPALKGWNFISTIDHTTEAGNLIRSMPGVEKVPTIYRSAKPICQHCNTARTRHETFILQNADSGEYKQIGRNCLRDFFEGDEPNQVAGLLEWWTDAAEMAEECGDGDYSGGNPNLVRYSLENVLTLTQAVIAHSGWLSRTKAREMEREVATADLVSSLLQQSEEIKELAKELEHKEEYEKIAVDALEWIRQASPDTEEDYIYNLYVTCKSDSVTYKLLGLACSLIVAYDRHLNGIRETKERASRPVSHHVGIVGKRCTFDVTVKFISTPSPGFRPGTSTTRVGYEDEAGNVLIWWCSGDLIGEVGESLKIAAMVKKHDVYHSKFGPINQTIINRVKVAK